MSTLIYVQKFKMNAMSLLDTTGSHIYVKAYMW